MTINHNENTETVASAQPFLNAEKEQMEELTRKAKESGANVEASASGFGEITPEIYAEPHKSEEVEAVEKEVVQAGLEEVKVENSGVSPEIQAKLDRLAEIEAAEKKKEKVIQEDPEEVKVENSGVSPEVQAKLDKLAEIEAAEKEEQEDLEKDPDYVKFNRPYKFEGKEYNGIKLDFDEMTGADILEAEEEFIATKTQTAAQTPLKELSKGYLTFFAARACAQPVDFIIGLDGKSFAKVTRRAQTFLLSED